VFNEFWQVRDENKDTPVNEVMFQFYLRVDEANLRFRADNKEGWKTDRGKSFILYGEPDEIERQKHQVDSPPYEIWIYLRLNQKLTFVDRSKNHNYKLVSIEEIKADSDE
jgi:GWxTD domain-containing protein